MKRQKAILATVLMMCSMQATAQQGLVINELMQSNINCVMDDLNEFPDSWLELYNAGTSAERLYNYQVGTTPNVDEAWRLPGQMVSPGGHVLVYCDKEANGLHTPFRLESGKGCSLYLFCNGEIVDKVEGLQKQPAPNIGYGRKTDGSSEWGYQLLPTPRTANSGEVCDHDHVLGEPVFSETGRVLTGSHTLRVAVTMPAGTPEGTVLRYTLDGSEPTEKSQKYLTPFTISSTRVIRMRPFCEGWLSPQAVTQSYIFFPRQLTLPVVSIASDRKYFDDGKLGIFANNNGNTRVDWRRPINIEFFFGEDCGSAINQLCETRIAGAASRGAAKKSLAIYAHKRFGTKRFSYEFFPDQCPGLTDYKSLVLRNAGNDFDYLYMRDAIVQRTMASHTDLDWQAWRPAIIYINGNYHGMLNIRERGNENNIATHYDGLEDIDLFENWNSLKEGDSENLDSFKTFYGEHGHTMAEYEEWMDCQEFINLMAMNLYFNNYDFPGNNIVMWRSRKADSDRKGFDGRWRWIAKDCDYTLGLYGDPVDYRILEWLYNPNFDSGKNWGANGYEGTRLFRRLMEDEDFSREFIDHCAIYMGDFLNEQGVREVWDPMYEMIKYEYPNHRKLINQWWPNYGDELNNAYKWLKKRTAIFYQQLGDYYKLGTPIQMTVNKENEPKDVGITFNGVRLSKGVFDGNFFAGRQITLQGEPVGEQTVTGWRVQQLTNGSSSVNEVDGPLLSMTMPKCSRLVITPIVGATNSIDIVEEKEWTWQRDEQFVYLTGVAAGTPITLYDLRGIIIFRNIATGDDLSLPVKTGEPYVLKVGATTIKL
ncbi:MAG: CotH kinase family protein [Prevotella sp.]|nr:CotH kinase family protein [Prevotella sp.]